MLYEDKDGNILTSEEVDDFSPWEIMDREIHVMNDMSV